MSALLLKGGRVIDPAAKLNQVCDVLIEDGIIQKVGLDIRADQAEVYDASDKIVVPGLIDMHTHLRELLSQIFVHGSVPLERRKAASHDGARSFGCHRSADDGTTPRHILCYHWTSVLNNVLDDGIHYGTLVHRK